MTRNRAHLAPWSPPRPPDYYTLPHWQRWVEQSSVAVQEGRAVRLVLCPQENAGRIIGQINFTNIIRGPFQACYLGFSLDQDEQGKSLMTEALQAAIRYAFETLRLHRIMANHRPENDRSARLLQRLNFRREGFAREYLYIDGAWRDHVLTSLHHPHPVAPQTGSIVPALKESDSTLLTPAAGTGSGLGMRSGCKLA